MIFYYQNLRTEVGLLKNTTGIASNTFYFTVKESHNLGVLSVCVLLNFSFNFEATLYEDTISICPVSLHFQNHIATCTSCILLMELVLKEV